MKTFQIPDGSPFNDIFDEASKQNSIILLYWTDGKKYYIFPQSNPSHRGETIIVACTKSEDGKSIKIQTKNAGMHMNFGDLMNLDKEKILFDKAEEMVQHLARLK